MGSIDKAGSGSAVASACPVNARDEYFFYEGQRLHALVWDAAEANSNRSPIVLLHGFMQSARGWANIAQELAKTHTVYALDLMGHGESAKPSDSERYAYADVVASVDAFLRTVVCVPTRSASSRSVSARSAAVDSASPRSTSARSPFGQRAHVVGYSMGARVALRLASTSKDVVASLVFESCNLGCADEAARALAQERNEGWVSRLRTGSMEDFVRYWESLPLFETQREQGLDVLLRPGRLDNDPAALALCLQGSGKQAMPLVAETLACLKESALPIAYIWGGLDKGCALVAQQLSEVGATTKMLNTGHNVHLEAPMLYLEEVRKFLISIDMDG